MTQKNYVGIPFFFAIAALVGACSSNSPEASVKKFYSAVDKGDLKTAKSFISEEISQTFGEAKITAGLREISKDIEKCGGIKNIKIDLEGKGEYREGTSEIEFKGDCEPEQEEVSLIQEDGAWKLSAQK